MSTVTLEAIKEEQNKLNAMIADFEAANSRRTIVLNDREISLEPGEHYAGIILNDLGRPVYHLVLLPGEAEDIDWPNAKEWAKKAGGDLPTRQEQALLYANLADEFQRDWYWSSEQRDALSDYVWCQSFDSGCQIGFRKGRELRARAVRRLTIQEDES